MPETHIVPVLTSASTTLREPVLPQLPSGIIESPKTPRLLTDETVVLETTVEHAENYPIEPLLPVTASFARDVARNILGDIHTESLYHNLRRNIYALSEYYVVQSDKGMVDVDVSGDKYQPRIYELLPSLRTALNPPDAIKNMQSHGSFVHRIFHDEVGNYCLVMQDTHVPEQTLTVVFQKNPQGPDVMKEALIQTAPLDEQDSLEIGQIALGAIRFAKEQLTAREEDEVYPAPPTPILLEGRRGREKLEEPKEEQPTDQFAALREFTRLAASELTMSLEESGAAADGILALAQAIISPNPRRRKKLTLYEDKYIPLTQIGDAQNMRVLQQRGMRNLPEDSVAVVQQLLATKQLRINLFLGNKNLFTRDKAYCLALQTPQGAFVMVYQRGKDGITVLKNLVYTNTENARKLSPFDYAYYALYQQFQSEFRMLKEICKNFEYEEV